MVDLLMSELRKIQIQDPSDATRLAGFDNLFKVLLTLDAPHHEIHEGDSFCSSAVDTSMGNGDTLVLAFKTMAGTKRAHIVVQFLALSGGHVEILEGPTWDNESGSLNPIFNRKRTSPALLSEMLEDSGQAAFTATGNLVLNPTTLAGGTALCPEYSFGTVSKPAVSGRELVEWVLRPDTQYAVRLTADAASNKGQLILAWYEHMDE